MPMARISLHKGKSPEYLQALADGVYESMVETFKTPPHDRFQIIDQHEPGAMIFDRHFFSDGRSDDFVIIEITVGRVRSTEVKRAFYKDLVARLAQAPGLRPADVLIIVSTSQEDEWSFSNGGLQLVDGA